MMSEFTLCLSASFSTDLIPQRIVPMAPLVSVTWDFHGQSHSWIPADAFLASGPTLTALTHTRCSVHWVTITEGSWHGVPILQLG